MKRSLSLHWPNNQSNQIGVPDAKISPQGSGKFMSHTHYFGDPRQITARFPSTCHTCGKPIKKGETIIYWPNGKKAGHYDCDIQDYRQSIASFEDEDRYNGVYH
jgi:hypothetical protein